MIRKAMINGFVSLCLFLALTWLGVPAYSIDTIEKMACDSNRLELFNAALEELERTYGSKVNRSNYECSRRINYHKKTDPFLSKHTVFEFKIYSGPHCGLQYVIAVNNDTHSTFAIMGIKDFNKTLDEALSRLKKDPLTTFYGSVFMENEMSLQFQSMHINTYNEVIKQEDLTISDANIRDYIQSIFDLLFSKMEGLSDGMILDDICKLKLRQNENVQKVKEMCKPVIAVEQENGFDVQATTWHKISGIVLNWHFHVAFNGEIKFLNIEEIASGVGEHSLCF